ncbi:putative heme d1 biosynthesis radical SAM protein NirJ2 [Clostridium aminobutyricum]|uniref:Heme d1 biosynthesis radical SAM protein NirJ2 n=1 Tax=Clostridium aminobutyricum TaxID=33953 RepID=A0A939IHY3_CLOAM|nr:putative heme d1 biosynthesis radical SAM protein NirJ2 [Clostridium aminobutyricum]MBN7771944.1 putative heme d1 biosynthesis radical SAM protein NirJ2 [Clostridium aminobutyricum]
MIVSWNTTNQCNMYCKHCYRDSGCLENSELTTQQGKELLNEMAKAGFKMIIFSGGEPLMRPDIFELVEHAVQLKLRPVFGTNGSLIDYNTALKLKEKGAMAMGISLDSLNAEKHNDFRGYPNAWEEAVEGMENCRKAGLPFQIHTTVMNWNQKEILDITDFAVKIGAKGHHIFFMVPTGRAQNMEEESLRAMEYEDLITNIMKKQQEVPIELKPTCAPQFMRIAKELGVAVRYSRGCLAGISYCIISPKGDVQPCAYIKNYIGNVKEIPFSEIWLNNPILKELRTLQYNGSCGSCGYKDLCGGCRARAAVYNKGDFMAEEPWCAISAGREA